MIRTIKIIWIVLGLTFVASFALPVDKDNDGYTYGIQHFCSAVFCLFWPPFWFLFPSSLSNIWFVWAWAATWEFLDEPTRQRDWKGIIIVGIFAFLFALIPVVMQVSKSEPKFAHVGVYAWIGSLLGMLLLTLKIGINRPDHK